MPSTDRQLPDDTSRLRGVRIVSLVHGAYYFLTGLWPLVSLRTFERVSGPKTDHWLVQAVGVLVTAIGAVLIVGGRRREQPLAIPELPLLAVGSAVGLTAIDIVYVTRRRISPVYLLDALGELALIAGWAAALAPFRRPPG